MQSREATLQVFPSATASQRSTSYQWKKSSGPQKCPHAADGNCPWTTSDSRSGANSGKS